MFSGRMLVLSARHLVVVGLAVGALALSANGALAASQKKIEHGHDMRFPVHMDYPGPNQPHSGRADTDPARTASQQTRAAITPKANYPTVCYQGVSYLQKYNGQGTFTNTADVGFGRSQAWVQYYWCPRWNGDTVGNNFSYGRAYAIDGCHSYRVGGGFGAAMKIWPTTNWVGDNEPATWYTNVCGTYIWDYSDTGDGSQQYTAWMLIADSDIRATIQVNWPTHQ